jgi:hypothetical protein
MLAPIYMCIYMYIYALLVLYSCCTSRYICNCCDPALLEYIHLYSCFTRTLLVLFLLFVCVCRLTGLVECVEESEGLRRDGACEHGVLQQRAAGEAPLHHPPHVSLLIHVAAAQAPTRLQERPLVSRVMQVRHACCMMPAYQCLCVLWGRQLDENTCRQRGVMRWAAGLRYAARGHEHCDCVV